MQVHIQGVRSLNSLVACVPVIESEIFGGASVQGLRSLISLKV